nr:hypothetical protein [Tanacetum cinerariifolium]
MSLYSRCSWSGGSFNCGNCRRCTNVSFGDEFVHNPDPILNNETPDYSYPPSQPQTSSSDQFHCFGCGDPLEEGVRFQRCTCKWCGNGLSKGFCFFYASRDENSSIDAPNLNSFDNPPDFSYQPPQPQYETYTYEMKSIINDIQIKDYRNEKIDIRYRRECECMIDELKEPEDSLIIGDEDLNTILEKETNEAIKSSVKNLVLIPSKSEDTSGSNSEYYLSSCDDFSPIDIPEEKSSKNSYDSNLDKPTLLVLPLSHANKDECFDPGGDVDEIGLLLYHDPSTFKMSVVSILEGFTDESPLEENDDLFELESKKNDWKKILYDAPIDDLMTEDKCFDPRGDINEIDAFLKFDVSTDIKDGFHGSKGDVLYLESSLSDDTIPNPHPEVFLDRDSRSLSDINDVKIMVKVFDPEIHEKKFSPIYESAIPLNEIVSQISPSIEIILVLPTFEEPEDSLIMGDEDPNTIPEKETDEVIKSSVEDLVPIPSESEDTSGSDSEYDLSSCDGFSPIDIPEEKFVTYSKPLFKFDDEYISSDVNPLSDELLENIKSKNSYDSNLDKPTLLVIPLFDANKDECFYPSGDVDEIGLLLYHDPSTFNMSVVSILEGFTDEPPLEENDDLFELESKKNE